MTQITLNPGERVEIRFTGREEWVLVEHGETEADDGQRSVIIFKDADSNPECIYISELEEEE